MVFTAAILVPPTVSRGPLAVHRTEAMRVTTLGKPVLTCRSEHAERGQSPDRSQRAGGGGAQGEAVKTYY